MRNIPKANRQERKSPVLEMELKSQNEYTLHLVQLLSVARLAAKNGGQVQEGAEKNIHHVTTADEPRDSAGDSRVHRNQQGKQLLAGK